MKSALKLLSCFVGNFRLCRDGVPLPPVKYSDCEIWEQSVGSALKDFKVGKLVNSVLVPLDNALPFLARPIRPELIPVSIT